MKKEQVDPIAIQLKSLTKHFRNLSRDNTRIIFEFCEYHYPTARKVLTVVNQLKNPIGIIQQLIKEPERTEQIIGKYLMEYDKRYGMEEEAVLTEQEQENKELKPLIDYEFFEHVPNDNIMHIMAYLEPYTFFEFSLTSRLNFEIAQSEAQNDYYRRLCTRLFTFDPPRQPQPCRFGKIRDYVLARPHEYGPNTKGAVQNKLRYYVWRWQLEQLGKLEQAYYKGFGSYERLFRMCPRLHLNGCYVQRDKYVKLGEKDEKNPIRPIHVIYFYRYLRFLEDGTVLYHVRNKRIKTEQLLKYLSKQVLEDPEQRDTLIGEYRHHKNKVFVKTVKDQEIFSYQLDIMTQPEQICHELRIAKYTLDLVDDQHDIHQVLYAASPKLENKSFFYLPSRALASENSPLALANSL